MVLLVAVTLNEVLDVLAVASWLAGKTIEKFFTLLLPIASEMVTL